MIEFFTFLIPDFTKIPPKLSLTTKKLCKKNNAFNKIHKLHICANFGFLADNGGLNLASNWHIISDMREDKYIINTYIKKGLVFNDPRRPDLINFYLQEMKFRRKLHESCIAEEDKIVDKCRMVAAPHTSFLPRSNFTEDLMRVAFNGYYCLRIHDSEFFISSSKDGTLDLTDVFYKEEASIGLKIPTIRDRNFKSGKNPYYELEFAKSSPGDLLCGREPNVKIIRVYFVGINKKVPTYELDQTEVYCIDGETKTLTKCQIEILQPDPKDPTLRFLKDGRVFLDDESSAPSFFDLNALWWLEKTTEEEISASCNRANLNLSLKLRQEICSGTLDWKGKNIGSGKACFPQGSEYARKLEALGRYRTGIADGYGDLWFERSQEDLVDYTINEEFEEREMNMTASNNLRKDLEKDIRKNSTYTSKSFKRSNAKENSNSLNTKYTERKGLNKS
jgi:hypothetical protein